MRSVMSHNFSQVPRADIQRSTFKRDCGYKTTFNSGYLVPVFTDEVLPGDSFKVNHALLARLATPIVPIMDNLHLDTFYFFVPNRLLWDNWERFNGQQDNPEDSTDYLIPQVTCPSGGFPALGVADYFGIPTSVDGLDVNALYFRAYNLIYNEWFRDENLIDSVSVPKGDGPDLDSNYSLLRRCKHHDYFTSCLPWPQKGPGVEVPLGQFAPVYGDGNSLGLNNGTTNYGLGKAVVKGTSESDVWHDGLGVKSTLYGSSTGTTSTLSSLGIADNTIVGLGVVTSGTSGLHADLSSATAVTINTLRQAFQLQRLYERDARGGTRYTEILRAHFGVVSPDSRLQRPEFLGSASSRINVTPVQQTSASDDTSPQGNLAAYGLCVDSSNGFNHSFVEHGVIIGLVNVWADLTYQQGLSKLFTRQTRFDYYWPALAHLGEQAVLNSEIYATGTATDDDVFGYQERYAEYRYKPSLITGKMRSTDPQSLDVWHLSQHFTSLPTLSEDFIHENPPIERVVAVTDEPQFILDMFFKVSSTRPMPVYGVPGMIDHF